MKHFWKIWITSAIIAIFISLLLCLPKFGNLPSGLNRDEAAIGYNSYSLLKTGKDEWGESWPTSITSFGDQKLPGYIYTLIPFIKIFGLETWVVRFPSLISGLLIIINMGLITIKLAKFSKYSNKIQVTVSSIVMALIAISPWHIHFSRVSYETHLAMALFTGGLACFIFGIDNKKRQVQNILVVVSSLLFSLTLLTYHSYQIFIPLFLFSLFLVFYKEIKKINKTSLIISIFIGLLTILVLFKGGIIQSNQIKSRGINPLSEQKMLINATQYRSNTNLPLIVEKILFNKFEERFFVFVQNYISTFSGTFFFINGSNHGDHNPGNGNNMHLFLAPFLLLGVFNIGKNYKKTSSKIIIAWLLIALIPSSITINPLLEVRLATVFPILELISAIGLFAILELLNRKQKILFVSLFTAIMFLSTIKFFIFYTKIAPEISQNNDNYHILARKLFEYKSRGGNIITQSPTSSPYIWYLFENKIDPNLAQEKMIHFPPTDEGFIHVKQIENVYFETINWNDFEKESKSVMLILKPEEVPEDKKDNPHYILLEKIYNKENLLIYEVWKYLPKKQS